MNLPEELTKLVLGSSDFNMRFVCKEFNDIIVEIHQKKIAQARKLCLMVDNLTEQILEVMNVDQYRENNREDIDIYEIRVNNLKEKVRKLASLFISEIYKGNIMTIKGISKVEGLFDFDGHNNLLALSTRTPGVVALSKYRPIPSHETICAGPKIYFNYIRAGTIYETRMDGLGELVKSISILMAAISLPK